LFHIPQRQRPMAKPKALCIAGAVGYRTVQRLAVHGAAYFDTDQRYPGWRQHAGVDVAGRRLVFQDEGRRQADRGGSLIRRWGAHRAWSWRLAAITGVAACGW